jgi:hypothetical protein
MGLMYATAGRWLLRHKGGPVVEYLLEEAFEALTRRKASRLCGDIRPRPKGASIPEGLISEHQRLSGTGAWPITSMSQMP